MLLLAALFKPRTLDQPFCSQECLSKSIVGMIKKNVSGGQTGADRAGLDVAIRWGFPHGGWCPKVGLICFCRVDMAKQVYSKKVNISMPRELYDYLKKIVDDHNAKPENAYCPTDFSKMVQKAIRLMKDEKN